MSLLEYLGLEYIFSDKFDKDINGIMSGLISSLGLIGWIIMLFLKPALIDQGIAVFNLLVAAILIILLIIRLVKARRKYDFICLAVSIIFFIIGYLKPYHSLFFHYEYTKIFSAIASTLVPLTIMNIVGLFIYTKKGVIGNIIESFKLIGLIIIGFVIAFLIGQTVTVILYFTKSYNIYDNIAYYHNIEYIEKREAKQYKDAQTGIINEITSYFNSLTTPFNEEDYNCTVKESESLFETSSKCRKDSIGKNLNDRDFNKSYGYNITKMKWEDNVTFVIEVGDLEWAKVYYIKYNIKEKTGEEVDDNYFSNIN